MLTNLIPYQISITHLLIVPQFVAFIDMESSSHQTLDLTLYSLKGQCTVYEAIQA